MANYTVIVVSHGRDTKDGIETSRTSDLHWAKSKAGVRWWLEKTTDYIVAQQQQRGILWDRHYAYVWEGHYRTLFDRPPDWIVRNTDRGGIDWERNDESE